MRHNQEETYVPTTTIIGYLWSKREALDVQDMPELLRLLADFNELGVDFLSIHEMTILGKPAGTEVMLDRKEPSDWDDLLARAITTAAVEDTVAMTTYRMEDDDL